MGKNDVAILGAGMHPWGKWGRNFAEYGVVAIKDAIKDAGVDWKDVDFVVGGDTMRNGYPGYVAGATFAKAMGWTGIPIASCYAACATGAQAIDDRPHADPRGHGRGRRRRRAPTPRPRASWLRTRASAPSTPTGCASACSARPTRPISVSGPQRRMDLYGATEQDFAHVKVKNSQHGFSEPERSLQEDLHRGGGARLADRLRAAAPARDLRDERRRCGTRHHPMDYAKKKGIKNPVRISGVSTISPTFPQTVIDMPDFSTDSAAGIPAPDRSFRDSIAYAAYRRRASARKTSTWPRSTTCPRPSSSTGTRTSACASPAKPRSCCATGDTAIGGRIPVNPSGGLGCFGEAVPAQAIAQVCELTWQLRGEAGERQVEGAKVGITANQGLFGHGSAVLCSR